MKRLVLFLGVLFCVGDSTGIAIAQAKGRGDTIRYSVPEFYTPVPATSRDTAFKFECYDRHDSLINKVTDFSLVYFYSVFKNYTDSTHTYVDAQGKRQFLPISTIVKRYDKAGRDKWICISYPSNKFQELIEYKNDIVKTDTIRSKGNVEIYRYYKVTTQKN